MSPVRAVPGRIRTLLDQNRARSAALGVALVLLLALGAYGNSLGNGFAYDDVHIVERHPAVASGDASRAATASYWPPERPGARGNLYRPLTLVSFTVERRLWGLNPLPFHAANVAAHAAASLLVFLLLARLGVGAGGRTVGAGLFALHPVHTEAVANVVGRGELYSALFVLAACLLHLRGREWGPGARSARVLGVAGLYLLALASKEMAVTLPALLLLLEALRDDERSYLARLLDDLPLFLLLGATLAAFFGLRHQVLGVFLGDEATSSFLSLGTGERLLTALSLWPEYLRLLVFPVDLSSSYHPGVVFPATSWEPRVWTGLLVVLGLALVALRTRRAEPMVAAGIGWFAVTILPVSNLLFPTGVVLAERTLYLPSVGLAFVAAGGVRAANALPSRRRVALGSAAAVVASLLLLRTVTRNPTWESTERVMRTLAREHPESQIAIRARARGLVERGRTREAGELFEIALTFAPGSYSLMGEAAEFFLEEGDSVRADSLLRRAIELRPGHSAPYEYLAETLIRRGLPDEAIRVAGRGLGRAGWTADLWALVSEAHILAGRIPPAEWAREAAVATDPTSLRDWRRLEELREKRGDEVGARAARTGLRRAGSGPARREG